MTRTVAGAAVAPDAGRAGAVDVSLVLERLGSWLRRAVPAVEWNAVAMSTLAQLADRGPLRVTDLVAAERITQPGMTGLLARMAAAGLVGRRPDPTDGRATLVTATPDGLAYLARIHESRAHTIAEQVRRLPPAHQQAIVDALDALEGLIAQPIDRGDQLR